MNHSANAGVRRQLLGIHSLLLGMEFRGSGLAVSIFMLSHLTDAKVSSPSLCIHAFRLYDEASKHGSGTLSRVSVKITGMYPLLAWTHCAFPALFTYGGTKDQAIAGVSREQPRLLQAAFSTSA